MIRTKVTRIVKLDDGHEVFIWLENGKSLSCSKDDGKEYEKAFELEVGDVVCYEEKKDDKILVISINN